MHASLEVETQVLFTLKSYFDAYAKRDIEAVMKCFSSSPDVLLLGTGHDNKALGEACVCDAIMREWACTESLQFRCDWHTVSVWSQVAWVAAEVTLTGTSEGAKFCVPLRLTLVLEQHTSRWFIAQYHLSDGCGRAEDIA
jgi:ketosteroid isomerase-like protein